MVFINQILCKTNLHRNNCICQSKVTSRGKNVFLNYSSLQVYKFLQFTGLEINGYVAFNL